jgi:hypothetical protein
MQIGKKVVCINDHWGMVRLPFDILPNKNEIYTIRDIVVDNSGMSFQFEEIINPTFNSNEIAFHSLNFRSVDYQFGEDICKEIEEIFWKWFKGSNKSING